MRLLPRIALFTAASLLVLAAPSPAQSPAPAVPATSGEVRPYLPDPDGNWIQLTQRAGA